MFRRSRLRSIQQHKRLHAASRQHTLHGESPAQRHIAQQGTDYPRETGRFTDVPRSTHGVAELYLAGCAGFPKRTADGVGRGWAEAGDSA